MTAKVCDGHPTPTLLNVHVLMQRGGVSAAIHILVHLLGNLLGMAEVRGRHGYPGVTGSCELVSYNLNLFEKKNRFLFRKKK